MDISLILKAAVFGMATLGLGAHYLMRNHPDKVSREISDYRDFRNKKLKKSFLND